MSTISQIQGNTGMGPRRKKINRGTAARKSIKEEAVINAQALRKDEAGIKIQKLISDLVSSGYEALVVATRVEEDMLIYQGSELGVDFLNNNEQLLKDFLPFCKNDLNIDDFDTTRLKPNETANQNGDIEADVDIGMEAEDGNDDTDVDDIDEGTRNDCLESEEIETDCSGETSLKLKKAKLSVKEKEIERGRIDKRKAKEKNQHDGSDLDSAPSNADENNENECKNEEDGRTGSGNKDEKPVKKRRVRSDRQKKMKVVDPKRCRDKTVVLPDEVMAGIYVKTYKRFIVGKDDTLADFLETDMNKEVLWRREKPVSKYDCSPDVVKWTDSKVNGELVLDHGCEVCGKRFIDRSNYRQHMWTHKGKPKCQQCGIDFRSNKKMHEHNEAVHGIEIPEKSYEPNFNINKDGERMPPYAVPVLNVNNEGKDDETSPPPYTVKSITQVVVENGLEGVNMFNNVQVPLGEAELGNHLQLRPNFPTEQDYFHPMDNLNVHHLNLSSI
ncbi:hypothetical protein MAR_028731 [Mya arenaria]|uniref:C2H2-type domain-containing protein n=1 Tax=Mya arenaria TaxID=6604 RepID=A0ABY7DGC9_MYAAR|nr:hypothetical protein MAR_028731 [Mya arenaria]